MSKNLYDVLGVNKSASQEQIKRAYRRKAAKIHPDKGGSANDMAEANRAYACLKDPVARLTYDQTGQEPQPTNEVGIATDKLMQAFNQVLHAPNNSTANYQKAVRNLLVTEQNKFSVARDGAKTMIKNLEKRRNKIRLKSGQGAINLWERLVDERLKQVNADLLKCEQEIKFYTMALDLLDKYESDDEQIQQSVVLPPIGLWSTTTSTGAW